MSYVNTFDFVCLTETHISGTPFDLNLFDSFAVFTSDGKKLCMSQQGRLSGGVLVLIKKEILLFFDRLETDADNTIIFKVNANIFGLEKDVVVICTYLPPCDSKYWNTTQHGYGFETIENCLMNIYEKYSNFSVLLCGDLNARTSSENYSALQGDFDVFDVQLGSDFLRNSKDLETNVFGEQLLELCNMYDLVVLNGLKDYLFDGEFTYICRSGSSVVDYFLASCDLLCSNVFCQFKVDNQVESDHLPVSVSMRLAKDIATDRTEQYVTYADKIVWDKEKENQFIDTLYNNDGIKLELENATRILENDVDRALSMFVDCLKDASSCMVKSVSSDSSKKHKGPGWFDLECKEAKKDSKRKLRKFRHSRMDEVRVEYVEAKKKYKELIKLKKRQFKRQKVEALANSLSNSGNFWKEVRSFGGDRKTIVKNNITITEWYDYFKGVFGNGENDNDFNNVQEGTEESVQFDDCNHILNQCITHGEVMNAIKDLSSGKSSGVDCILSEMLKVGGALVVNFLTKLFNTIFDKCMYPSEWAKAIVVPIFKKGNQENPDNYRPISLLSIISKCYTSVLNKRLYNWLENNDKICEQQAGFRKNYSTTDQIFNLYAMVQKCLCRNGQKLYVGFVDFRKAFDSVRHDKLLEALHNEGISGKFFLAIKSMYSSLISCVRCKGQCSPFFECPTGVRQGCIISPTLFSLFINQLANHICENGKHGFQMLPGLMELFILLFADDVVLISTTSSGLQHQLNLLKTCCDQLHLNVNKDKTKIMVFRKGGFLAKHEKWFFDGKQLEVVNKYCYLGFVFTTKLSAKLGTQHLVLKGKKAVMYLNTLFGKCKDMFKEIFFRIFDAKVQSILLYSSEIWGLQRLEHLEKVHLLACKRFLGVPVKTFNRMVYGELGRFPLYINSTIRCVKYWFRLLQLDDSRLPHQAYKMLFNVDENGKFCWVTQVREILCNTGFAHVWLNQGVQSIPVFIKQFRQRLIDVYNQEWFSTLRDKECYSVYSFFKFTLLPEPYLSFVDIYCFRVAFTQIRLHALPLNNNVHRYSEISSNRNCVTCNRMVEDEKHLIFECPLYSDLRKRFIGDVIYLPFSCLVKGTDLALTQSVAKFVFHSMKRRSAHICNEIV